MGLLFSGCTGRAALGGDAAANEGGRGRSAGVRVTGSIKGEGIRAAISGKQIIVGRSGKIEELERSTSHFAAQQGN
jgi:cation transport ATPase